MQLFSITRLPAFGEKPCAVDACVCTSSSESSVAMIAVQCGALAVDGES
jgi:hypothetical protein